MKKGYIIGFFFIGIIFFVLLNTFINSRNEYMSTYNFVITKIEITPTNRLILYNNNEKIELWNYIISKNQGVEIGDVFYKKKCSKFLYIYKKDIKGKYRESLKVKPSGMFPFEWFCSQ